MAFDVAGAKGAGYSDDEISDFLAANPDAAGFDAAGAQRAGYSPSEIVGFLTSQKTAGDGIIASAMNALTDAGKAVPAEFGRLGVSAGELGRSLVGAAAGRLNQVGVLSDSANDAIDRSIVDAFQRDQRAETASPSYQAQTTLGQVAQSLAHMAPAIAASLVAPEVALPAFAAQGGWDAGKGAIDSGSSLANAQLKAGSQAVLNSILGEYIGRAGNALLPKIPVIGGAFVPAAADTLRQVVARSAQGAATMAAFKPAGTLLDWAADQFTGESAGKKYEPMPTAADLLTGALMAVPHAAMEFANRNALPVAPTVFADGSAALAHKNGSLFSSADAANAFIDANAIDDASVIPVTSKTFDASAGNDKVLGYAVKPPASPTEATSDNAQPPTLTPDQLTNGAQARLAELDRKAVGTENTVAMHDGKPVAIPGEQPQILSDAEQAERNFLASNLHDPDLLARGYGVNLDKTQAINAQSLDVTDDAAVARHADAQQLRIGADLNDLPGQPVDTEAGARSTGFGERDINYERNRLGQETGAHAVDGESIDAMPKGSSDETETPVESKPAGASDADRDGDAALADAQRQRQEARTVAERMAAAERLAQVHRDIAARQEAGAENLRLGKNPEDGWSGQGGIVDGPIASRQGMSKYPRTTNAPSMAKPLRPTSRALPEDATTNIVDSPQIRKSISEDRPSAGLSVSGASNILHAKFGKGFLNLRDSGILKIVQSFNDLPAGARAGMDGSEGGVYWKGTGYLIADNQSRSQIVRDVIHEIGEHHGLQRMMGDDAYAKLLRDVAVMKRTGNRLVSEIWAAVKRSYDYPEGSEAFMKEVVAKLGETAAGRATSLWSRITIAIKLFLNKMGLRNFNERDVADLVTASLRKTMDEAGKDRGSATDGSDARVNIRQFGIPKEAGMPISSYATDADIKANPHYRAAKAGNVQAAIQLVRDMVKPDSIEAAKQRFGSDAIYASPMAAEQSGRNAIPDALAMHYAKETGGSAADDIYQVDSAHHTGADAMERLVSKPQFYGDVAPGGRYVLTDDVTTMGGTLAEMSNYIQSKGGKVVGFVTLVNAGRSAKMLPGKYVINELERRYGDEIRNRFGIEPSALTDNEARYLIGFKNADELRARAARAVEATAESQLRVFAKGISGRQDFPRERLSLDQSSAPVESAQGIGNNQDRLAERQGDRLEQSSRKPDDDSAASRQDRPSAGLSISGASNILRAKFGKGFLNLRDSGILKIVQSFDDLPAGARAGMDGSEGGVYWKGTGYVIADNQSRSQIVRDVIHEIGEHHGLQRMMGDDAYAKLLRDVAVMKRTGNRLVSEIWAAVKRSYDYPEGSEAFVKEVVAKLGETAAGRATSLWSRITIAIKLFLNKMGLRNFNARDVADLVAASLRKTMNGAARGKPSETQAASSRPAPESAKSAPREAIRKALRIMATPEWQTYRNTRDPTDRGDLKDAEEFIRDPSNAESDRALYAEILLDRVHDESRRAVGVSPQAMLDDMDFTPSEGVVSWVDPASLGNESSAKKGGMISREHARAIQWLGQRLDTEVHFFRQEWTSAGVEGITSADYPDTIFINAVSGSVGWQYLVGHEFLHRMPDDLKNEFIKSIKKEVTPENYRRAKHYVNQPTLPEHKQWEEIAADLMGNRFGESAFWDRVLARISDPSLMQKLLDYLKNFLAKLRQISRPPYETDHFVRNVDRMRDEAVRILRSHIDRKCAARGLSNAVEDDGPRASRISPSDDIRAQSLADSGNADRRSDAARSEPPEHPPDTTMTGRRSAGPSNPEKATLSGGLSVSGAGDAVFADKQDDGSKRGNGNDSASVEPNDSVWRSAQEAALAYCAKVPGAKIEFVEIGGNIVSWLLNAAGEPLSSWGVLTAYAVEAKRTSAEKSMQREVAKDDQGDDGGHLVAFSFVGNQGLRNMFSQAKNFNRSAYLAMENDFRRYIDDGNRVVFNHVLGDFDANGRPGSVAIEFRVTGEEGRQVDRFKQVFRNEPGQIYMRRHWTK